MPASLENLLAEFHDGKARPLGDTAGGLRDFAPLFADEGVDILFVAALMVIQALRSHPVFGFALGLGPVVDRLDVIAVPWGDGVGVVALHPFAGTEPRPALIERHNVHLGLVDDYPNTTARRPWVERFIRPSESWSRVEPHRFIAALDLFAEQLDLPAVVMPRPAWRPLNKPAPPAGVNDAAGTLLGSLGVAGRYGTKSAFTTAWHAVRGSTHLEIGGSATTVVHSVPDHDIAVLDGTSVAVATATVGGVRDDEPGVRNAVTFNGKASGVTPTAISGVDPAVSTTSSHAAHVYTEPDATNGDSGCALLDDRDRVIGFCREETPATSAFHAVSWVWAKHALHAAGLVI